MRRLDQVWIAIWRHSVEQWSWRTFMVTLVINQAVGPLVGLLVWTAVDPGSTQVRNYFFALLVVQLLTVSQEDHTLAATIYSGGLADLLLLPQPVIVEFIGTNTSQRLWHAIFGLPIMVAVGLIGGTHLTVSDVLLAVPALLVAGALRFLLTVAVACTAFWTQRASALVALANTVIYLLGGTAAPMFLIPGHLARLGRLLPFWSMLSWPSEVAAAGVLSQRQLLIGYATALSWLFAFTAAATLIWRRGQRSFTAVAA